MNVKRFCSVIIAVVGFIFANAQDKVILVAGAGTSTPISVRLTNGKTYNVHGSIEVPGNYSVSSAKDANGNKIRWNFSHSGGTSKGKRYSINTYTFTPASSSSPTNSLRNNSGKYDYKTPRSRSERERHTSVTYNAPVSPDITEVLSVWDIKYHNKPVVLLGYSYSSPSCADYGKIFDKLSSDYDSKIEFYKIKVNNLAEDDIVKDFNGDEAPVTVFIWDPLGDATVYNKMVRGAISYLELKEYTEEMLSKHYTNVKPKLSITDNINYSSTEKLKSWPEVPEYGTMPFSPTPEILPYLGKWVGYEDGDESIISFWEEDGRILCTAGTNSPHRIAVYSTPYWWVGAYRWEKSENGIWISDVISATKRDYSDSSVIDYGFYRDKILIVDGDELIVTVKEYKDWNNWNNRVVNREFTCRYKKSTL